MIDGKETFTAAVELERYLEIDGVLLASLHMKPILSRRQSLDNVQNSCLLTVAKNYSECWVSWQIAEKGLRGDARLLKYGLAKSLTFTVASWTIE